LTSQPLTTLLTRLEQKVDSIVVIDLDENDKITRLEDKWGGEDPPTYYGALLLRRANARIASWLIKVPKWQA